MRSFKMREFFIPSAQTGERLHCIEWIPVGPIKAVVQIAHGMIEYIERYNEFAINLVQEGYAVVGHDHLGHGRTARSDEDLGYFSKKNGSNIVIKDMYQITKHAKNKFPNVPLYIFGHSMGSFFTRKYITIYGNKIDGVILSGTGYQPLPVVITGKFIANILCFMKGSRYRSDFLHRMTVGRFNKKFKPNRTKNDWLSKDTGKVDEYNGSKYCNFKFTVGAYRDFFTILLQLDLQTHFDRIPKSLPIFFISGDQDPVGDFTKGVFQSYHIYSKLGLEDLSIKLYENNRHELINEINRDIVFKDIVTWLEERI